MLEGSYPDRSVYWRIFGAGTHVLFSLALEWRGYCGVALSVDRGGVRVVG